MKKLKSIFWAALLTAVPGSIAGADDASGKYTWFGTGGKSCATILESYRKDTFLYKDAHAWISGYMTAAGFYNSTQKPFGDVADPGAIMYLIRQHCEAKPLDTFSNAAIFVAEQLLDKAGRR